MALFARWRAERDLQRKAATFVDALFREPDPADVEWLAQHGDARRRRSRDAGSSATRGARSG